MSNTPFSILSTSQFEEWYSSFADGVKGLQALLERIQNRVTYSSPCVSAMTKVLLNVEKSLIAFLSAAMALRATTTNDKKLVRAENSWITNAIADLRIECHKYSLTVLLIATATERQVAIFTRRKTTMNANIWRRLSDKEYANRGIKESGASSTSMLVSSTFSTCTSTGIQSGWSSSSNSTDSAQTIDSYPEDDPTAPSTLYKYLDA